ncbi:hypothetical protein RGQ29_029659 [Quercus rubra]|uniref:Uncharacterized protein n=1 Tax=Quercus rubra TaxID=3512 RepID=A0AAN7IGY5_QUERU|nr:hypothetical protein RGQ29_029659 [Quercus rubra]
MTCLLQIPNHVAIKIGLELKKLLIDNSLLDVSQSDLEANLFKSTVVLKIKVLYVQHIYAHLSTFKDKKRRKKRRSNTLTRPYLKYCKTYHRSC